MIKNSTNHRSFLLTGLLSLLLPQTIQAGLVKTDHIWNTRNVHVCWINPGSHNSVERTWVRDAIANTWEAVSEIRFTGWGTCNSSNTDSVKIRIESRQPQTTALGSELAGKSVGVYLNFELDGSAYNGNCLTNAARRDCIEDIAIHEFGHVLSFAHEQSRSDTPDWCTRGDGGEVADTAVGYWDIDSVMNYCNPVWNGDGIISATDLKMAQVFYGSEKNIGSRRYSTDNANEQWWVNLNNDGYPDLIYKRANTREYWVRLGRAGNNTFSDSRWGTRSHGLDDSTQQWWVDINGDNRDDLIYKRRNTREYWAKINNGSSLGSDRRIGTRRYGLDDSSLQWWADMNGDNIADLVYKRRGQRQYWVKLTSNSNLGSDSRWGTRSYGLDDRQHQWLIDIDNNGRTDVIYKRSGTRDFWVKLNNGSSLGSDRRWGTRRYSIPEPLFDQWVDLNNDNLPDLVYKRDGNREYWVKYNNGSSLSSDIKIGERKHGLHDAKTQWWIDTNADGHLDLVYQRQGRRDYHIVPFNGVILGFDNPVSHRTSPVDDIMDQWVMDFDRDGTPEIFYKAGSSNTYRLLHPVQFP